MHRFIFGGPKFIYEIGGVGDQVEYDSIGEALDAARQEVSDNVGDFRADLSVGIYTPDIEIIDLETHTVVKRVGALEHLED